MSDDAESILMQARNGSSRALEVFMWRVLKRTYPGWTWRTEVDPWGGVAKIQNMDLSTKFGYTIPIRSMTGKNTTAKTIRGGGEILERYRKKRSGVDFWDKFNVPRVTPNSLEAAGGDHSERLF